MKHPHPLPALAVIGACLATLAGAATAYASTGAATARTAPAGYKIVSKQFTATAGSESNGAVPCPKATVPIGGSVFADSSPELRVNVSGSFPFGGFWAGEVTNSSTTSTTFEVVAVCANRPTGYKVVHSASVANPALAQSQAATTCPAGTMPLGGGGAPASSSTDITMNGTAPSGSSWIVRQNNTGATPTSFEAVAVCGKLHGYRVVKGKPFTVASGGQAGSFATCPAPTVPIGGGVLTGRSSVGVSFQGSFPTGHEWEAFMTNSSEGPTTTNAVVVCASH